jgi:hypothetical protein
MSKCDTDDPDSRGFGAYISTLFDESAPAKEDGSRRIVAGVLQRVPRTFQKKPLLRVEDFSFAWAIPEERGIEFIDTIQHDASTNEVLASTVCWIRAGPAKVVIAELPDRFMT